MIERSCATLAKVYPLDVKMNIQLSIEDRVVIAYNLNVRISEMEKRKKDCEQVYPVGAEFWASQITELEAIIKKLDTSVTAL